MCYPLCLMCFSSAKHSLRSSMVKKLLVDRAKDKHSSESTNTSLIRHSDLFFQNYSDISIFTKYCLPMRYISKPLHPVHTLTGWNSAACENSCASPDEERNQVLTAASRAWLFPACHEASLKGNIISIYKSQIWS